MKLEDDGAASVGELVEAAIDGDAAALARLLAQCQPDMRRYARGACANEDIEEAVQDALLILYRRLGTLRTLASLSAWIFRIVKHACLNRLRRRRDWQLDEGLAAALPEPTDLALRSDLARAIEALPQIYREVVILRDVNGFSAAETAGRTGSSVDAVKSRLHRARYLLREQLR